LEVDSARAKAQLLCQQRAGEPSAGLKKFMLFLQIRGVEPRPYESIADASARALEISSHELRDLLAQGIDPIHKYFTEHGVFEEIERMKAAGTWSSGGGESKSVRA
jgi:hypothetical protein